MRKSLSDLVNSALSEADSSLKLASARDAAGAVVATDFLEAELGSTARVERGAIEAPVEKTASKGKLSSATVRESAAHALKLATALEHSAHIVAKLANSPLDAPGPAVMESGFEGAATTSPKAHANVSDKITGPSLSNSDLPTDKADHTGKLDGQQPPNNTGKKASLDKTASARMLRAKQAQAEMLLRLGQTKAAELVLAEVEKLAQDPSSPQPSLPAHSNDFMLTKDPDVNSNEIPDNAGIISMTKAQAKDRSVRTATEHISETPKVDNAVAAHALSTTGQKVSHVLVGKTKQASAVSPAVARAYLERAVKIAHDPDADPGERSRAQQIVSAIQAKTQVDPSSLLG